MTTTAPRPAAAGAPAAAAAPPGAGGFTHRQILTIISGLMLGMFLASLDQTVVSTAIRTISDDLHGYSLQAWATTAFLITSTISTPLYGKLSDLYGRKPFYLLAISLFVLGSALCGISRDMYELAAFRAFQGLGAGGLMSLALAIVGDVVPPRQRARYQAYFMAVFGSSSVLGPVIGGVLAGQHSLLWISGWRWIFYVNVPIGVAALLVVSRNLRIPHTRREHRIDWPGAIALIVTLVPLLIVAEQGRTWGWGSGRSIATYAVAAVGLVAFLLVERAYKDDALLPLRLFKLRTFAVGVGASAIVGVGMFGGLALLPQYLQVVKGSSPTVAGLQLIPLVFGIMIAAQVSGRLIGRTGRYKVFPLIGTAVMVVSMVWFARTGADTAVWQLMIPMFFFGAGLGLNMQPVILAVQNAVSIREIGVATSSVTFFRQMGGTLGTAVFLSILFSTVGGNISDAVTSASKTSAFQAALKAHPADAKTLTSSSSGSLNDTSFISKLDAVIAHPFKVGFTDSMDLIFWIAAAILLVGFLVTWFLPELPLRTGSAMAARAAEQAPGAKGDGPALVTAASNGASGAAGDSALASVSPDGAAGQPQTAEVAAGRHGAATRWEGPSSPDEQPATVAP